MLSKESTDLLREIKVAFDEVPRIGSVRDSMGLVSISELKKEEWYDEYYVVPTRCERLYHERIQYDMEFPFVVNMYGKSREDIKKYIKYEELFAAWVYIISHEPCIKKLTLHWLLYDVPKRGRMNNRETVIPHMVNTGYTYRCKSDNTITLFRIEDAYKVFVHETIHSFGYDVWLLGSSNVMELRYGSYVVDAYEVCCELFARFVAIANERDPEKTLRANIKWGLSQASRFLGEEEFRDILLQGRTREYKEETPAFSYYVATAILLYEYCYGSESKKVGSYYNYIKEVMEKYMRGEKREEWDNMFLLMDSITGTMQMLAP